MPSDGCYESALKEFGPETALRQGLLLNCPICSGTPCSTIHFTYDVGDPPSPLASIRVKPLSQEPYYQVLNRDDLVALKDAIEKTLELMG